MAFDEGGNRIVVADSGGGVGGENRLWMVNIDRTTGKLEIDTRFRNEGSDQPGFSFDLKEWPHGATGPRRTAPCSCPDELEDKCQYLSVTSGWFE